MKSKPPAKPRSNVLTYVLLGLFGLPFAVIGLVADAALVRLGFDEIRMRFWSEVPCQILATELKEKIDGDSTTFRVIAEYRYQVNGIDYVGHRVDER